MRKITLNIAELSFSFLFDSFPSDFAERFKERYNPFFSSFSEGNFVKVCFSNDVFKLKDGVDMEEKNFLTIVRKDFLFKADKKSKKLLIKPDIYSFDSFLRVYVSYLLNCGDGFLIHSSGFNYKDKAFIFIGKSGAGKTTIANIFSKFNILSDELVALRIIEGKFFAFSTPFWGEMKNEEKNLKSKLKKIFFIKKHNDNREVGIRKKEALLKILRCVMNFSKEKEALKKIASKAVFLAEVDSSELFFSKSESLIDYFRVKSYIK